MKKDDTLKKTLQNFETTIEQMEEKRKGIFTDWLQIQTNYLKWETSFDPKHLRAYRRGEIVLAHFGFNVGTEYGGIHYATIVRNSSKNNPNLNIVPLTSLANDVDEETIQRDRVLLGLIDGLNGLKSVAIPDQMRSISKLRVIKPKKQSQSVFKLSIEQMDMLDDKIRRLYTKI